MLPAFSRTSLTVFQLPHLSDAVQMSTGNPVYLKRVKTGGDEMKIALMLSPTNRQPDSRNHCVPILDHFLDETEPEVSYIVMPLLRHFNFPPFEVVDNVIDFVDQILEVSFLTRWSLTPPF